MTIDEDDATLDEEEARLVGQPAGTPLRSLPIEALRLLVIHYFDAQIAELFIETYYGQIMGSSWWAWNGARLGALRPLMGLEAFDVLKAEKAAEWERKCVEADAAERALPPCVACGRPRTLADEGYHKDWKMCWDCVTRSARERQSGPDDHKVAPFDPDDDDIPF